MIRRIDYDPVLDHATIRGSLLFMPGRGESYEKYLEAFDHWRGQGWRVSASDWRGQSGSGRLGADSITGHVDDFAVWIADLAAFWAAWRAECEGPHVLIAHSMGGNLALRAVIERRVDPDALVLASPMLGLFPRHVPTALLYAAARVMGSAGDRRRPAWRWSEKPGELPADRSELLTHDPDRYADEQWWRDARPELVMGPASWGWVAAALASIRRIDRAGALEGVSVPTLLIGATDDRLVTFDAIARAAQRLPRGELVRFGGEARHEILREVNRVRNRALRAIDEFLDRTAPVVP